MQMNNRKNKCAQPKQKIGGAHESNRLAYASARFAGRDPAPDTDPHSSYWRDAHPIVADCDACGIPVPGHRTEIRSRWSFKNLYFLFVCPYLELNLNPNPSLAAVTNELWKWDVAEVFPGPELGDIERYREFEVSPQGEWVDVDVDLARPRHEDGWIWKSGVEVSARIDAADQVWYGFLCIPFAAIDARIPASGNRLRANFFRMQGPGPNRVEIAWRPTYKSTFHAPESFGWLELLSN